MIDSEWEVVIPFPHRRARGFVFTTGEMHNRYFSGQIFFQGKMLMNSAQFGLLLVLAFTFGCGDAGPPLRTVTGTVSSSGAPLTEATITFEDASRGVANTADVRDGVYEIQLLDGEYSVAVTPVLEVVIPDDCPPREVYVNPELVPERYMYGRTSGLSHAVLSDGMYNVMLTE